MNQDFSRLIRFRDEQAQVCYANLFVELPLDQIIGSQVQLLRGTWTLDFMTQIRQNGQQRQREIRFVLTSVFPDFLPDTLPTSEHIHISMHRGELQRIMQKKRM